MRGRGLLFLVAGLYALGILVPAAVLAGILFTSLEREREASAEKRQLELRDAGDAVIEAIETEFGRGRERPPEDPVGPAQPHLRKLWGPSAPKPGLVRIVVNSSRSGLAIHPFERVIDTRAAPEDSLLITSSEFRSAMLAEQRGDHAEAAGRLNLALAGTSDSREALAIRLALSRALLAQRETEAARGILADIDITDSSFDPHLRLRWLDAMRAVAKQANPIRFAPALRRDLEGLLETEAHRLGYFVWMDAASRWSLYSRWSSPAATAFRELQSVYEFLSMNRSKLDALRQGASLVWSEPLTSYREEEHGGRRVRVGRTHWPLAERDWVVTTTVPNSATADAPVTFMAVDDLLSRARRNGLDRYLLRREFELAARSRDKTGEIRLARLGRTLGIVDRAPVGDSVWDDPDSRLLLILAGLTLLGLLGGFGVTLWAVNKQARLARLRADFISSVSHELKTPLTSLLLFSDLLRSGRVTDAEKVSEYHDFMGEESAKLAHLVANILDFARLEEGRKTYSFTPIEVGEVLRHTAAAFSARAEAAGATVECDGLPDDAQCVRADRDALERVLANLLDNAIKYGTKGGGAIQLGARRIGEEIRITVTDHGPGIPPAARRRVFTRFTRGDHHGPDAPPGSGLGLAIVADLIAAHDGRVTVADTEGGGTTVTVVLPRAAAPASGKAALQSDHPEEQA